MRLTRIWMSTLCLALTAAVHGQEDVEPPGDDKGLKTQTLEVGAAVMQTDSPVDALNIHLVGIHPMKADPNHQMDAHHFCHQVNKDFAQCALFDGSGGDANLNGVEYIISERLFESLPEEEKQYWHPHNYEILSGTLVGPRLPAAAERELMREKMNSYGKTWHLWNSGNSNTEPDELPLGEPRLAWSLNRDNEAEPELLERRQEQLEMELAEIRERRAELRELAKPQRGVDALKGKFGRPTEPIDGVEEKSSSSGN